MLGPSCYLNRVKPYFVYDIKEINIISRMNSGWNHTKLIQSTQTRYLVDLARLREGDMMQLPPFI